VASVSGDRGPGRARVGNSMLQRRKASCLFPVSPVRSDVVAGGERVRVIGPGRAPASGSSCCERRKGSCLFPVCPVQEATLIGVASVLG